MKQIKLIASLLAICTLASCFNEARHISLLEQKAPKALPGYCELHYPCIDSVIKQAPIVLPGDTVFSNDTTIIHRNDTTIRTIKIKSFIHDTLVNTTTVYQSDKKLLALLRINNQELSDKNKKLEANLSQRTHERNVWRIVAICAIVAIVGGVALMILRK